MSPSHHKTLGGRMSYGYPGPGGQQQPQQPPQQWQGQQPPPPQGWQQQAGPGWGGPPPQPRKSNTGKIVGFSCLGVVALFVVLGVVGAALGGGDDSSDGKAVAAKSSAPGKSSAPAAEGEKPAAEEEPKVDSGPEGDVKITSCSVDSATTWASADVTITNRSSKRSNYIVSVEFVDSSGTRLGEAMAAANNVAAGQKVKQKAQGLDAIRGKIECKVTEVTRYAS